MDDITVERLYSEKQKALELTLLTSEEGLKRSIPGSEIHRPGLALAGYVERFANQRTQVLGETEMTFLSSQDQQGRKKAVNNIFRFDLPCLIITKGLTPPQELLESPPCSEIAEKDVDKQVVQHFLQFYEGLEYHL